VRNVNANGLLNVAIFNEAVVDEWRMLRLCGDPTTNTGGYSAFSGDMRSDVCVDVATERLPDFLDRKGITRVALLKLDCEGGEYQILRSMVDRLDQVAMLITEVHENNATRAEYGSGARLIADMEARIPHVRASLITIPDALNAHGQSIVLTTKEYTPCLL